MSGSCSLGTTLCGTPAVVRPGLSCGPTCAFRRRLQNLFCRAVWYLLYLRCCPGWPMAQVFSASAVVALTSSWLRRAIRLDWLRVSADLAGTAPTLPSWCVIHKRFDMSQAEFIKRWCGSTMCWPRCLRMQTGQLLCVYMCHPWLQGDYNQGVLYSGSGYSHRCSTMGELVRSL
jgi:hypothetical protein